VRSYSERCGNLLTDSERKKGIGKGRSEALIRPRCRDVLKLVESRGNGAQCRDLADIDTAIIVFVVLGAVV